jgi:hypothetical protein
MPHDARMNRVPRYLPKVDLHAAGLLLIAGYARMARQAHDAAPALLLEILLARNPRAGVPLLGVVG